jgi:dienelactone hydrolase
VALAADIYGKGVRPESHEQAGKIAGAFKNNREQMRARAKAALDFVQSLEQVDAGKVAAIGYCFGGTTVLEMARAGMDLRGVASFHGGLDTPSPAEKGAVKAQVLVFHGAEDPHVKPEQVSAFQKEMTDAGADWQLVVLGGAVHSFTVPEAGNDKSKGSAYNEEADKRSWTMLQDFLTDIFA